MSLSYLLRLPGLKFEPWLKKMEKIYTFGTKLCSDSKTWNSTCSVVDAGLTLPVYRAVLKILRILRTHWQAGLP
jgi:hypothetical protein